MDWTELSNRLADGAKVYKAFKDGADAASMLGGFERAHTELSAQYEALVAQIEQAKATIQTAKVEATLLRDRASQDIAQQWAEFQSDYARRRETAENELDAWQVKTAAQAATYAAEATTWKAQIDTLTNQASQINAQIQSLIRVRDSLKAQLQSIA